MAYNAGKNGQPRMKRHLGSNLSQGSLTLVVLLEPVKQEIISLHFKVSVARFVSFQSIETVDSGT